MNTRPHAHSASSFAIAPGASDRRGGTAAGLICLSVCRETEKEVVTGQSSNFTPDILMVSFICFM